MPLQTVPADPSNPAAAAVTLSGTATYDSVPNPSGRLVYTDTTAKPVRGASIDVIDASGNKIAVAVTDDNGAYSANVPANTNVAVRVYAQTVRPVGGSSSWDVSVRDNTQGNGVYSMQSPLFATGTAAVTRNLRADSGWGGSSYTGPRTSGPFAVMDTIYTAMQKVLSVAPNTGFPTLRVYWSVNNTNASGNIAIGQVGGTYFLPNSSGPEIYVLGKADVDTDEFDSPVIAHEWGHYYQASFSRDDSPGGQHNTNERIDRRLAFSEGWGNGWSGIALGRSNYVDSTGPGQQTPGVLDLTRGPSTNPGWYREVSIQSVLWNLNQQVGFKPINDAMTSFTMRSGVPVTSIHAFAAAFNTVAPASATVLATLLTGQNISAAANDPYGAQETNAGGTPTVANVLPLYKAATVGVPAQACVSNTAGNDNKLGSFAYLRFTAPAARDYQIAIGSPAGASPAFGVYQGKSLALNGTRVTLAAGDFVLVVRDVNNSGAATCFAVAVS